MDQSQDLKDKKIEVEFKNETYKVYDSVDPKRLEHESWEDYKVRKKLMTYIKAARKRIRNINYVSSQLIPAMTQENKIVKINNNVLYIGKSKGISYENKKYVLEQPSELKVGDVYVKVRKSGYEKEFIVQNEGEIESLLKQENIKIKKYEQGRNI